MFFKVTNNHINIFFIENINLELIEIFEYDTNIIQLQ